MDRYGQFCPIAKALEMLGEKWTFLIIREMLHGRMRFGEIHRALPRLSPALLTRRLAHLVDTGLIQRKKARDHHGHEYHLTQAGRDAAPIIEQLGLWGIKWADSQVAPEDASGYILMEDLRRGMDVSQLPQEICVLEFNLAHGPRHELWWFVIGNGEVDLCDRDPGHEVDVYIETPVRTLVDYWLGRISMHAAQREGNLSIHGKKALVRSVGRWLGRSPLAAH